MARRLGAHASGPALVVQKTHSSPGFATAICPDPGIQRLKTKNKLTARCVQGLRGAHPVAGSTLPTSLCQVS